MRKLFSLVCFNGNLVPFYKTIPERFLSRSKRIVNSFVNVPYGCFLIRFRYNVWYFGFDTLGYGFLEVLLLGVVLIAGKVTLNFDLHRLSFMKYKLRQLLEP